MTWCIYLTSSQLLQIKSPFLTYFLAVLRCPVDGGAVRGLVFPRWVGVGGRPGREPPDVQKVRFTPPRLFSKTQNHESARTPSSERGPHHLVSEPRGPIPHERVDGALVVRLPPDVERPPLPPREPYHPVHRPEPPLHEVLQHLLP